MSCELTDERIHDYVDGELSVDERREMDRHVRECPRCAREAERVRELKARVAELPSEIRPARDLWPGIERRIRGEGAPVEAGDDPAAERLEGAFWARPSLLAAAALVLVVLSSGITALLLPGGRTVVTLPGEARSVSEGAALARIRDAESEYLRALEGLVDELERSRDDVSPETLMVIDKNLEIIDEAIRQTRTALEFDPDNRELASLLTSAYERKVELLRRVDRSAGL